jgi:putative SOS response-associated peptidase YedK
MIFRYSRISSTPLATPRGAALSKADTVPSFAILTDEPNALVAPYHDRMPVVLDEVDRWRTSILDAITPAAPDQFALAAGYRAVNKVS